MRILKSILIAAGAMLVISQSALMAQAATTTTTLSMSSKGNPVSDAGSIASPSALTLTAAVTAGGAPVTSGQVNFCDATAAHCTDIHLLGTAQIIQSGPNLGKAILTYVPGIGSHSYKAVFLGTPNGVANNSASTSNTASLQVSGEFPTSLSIFNETDTGHAPYTIDSTLYAGTNRPAQPVPTGTVTIVDQTNNNAPVGSASLVPGTAAAAFTNTVNGAGVTTSFNATAMVAADLNGDGIPDVVVGGTTDATTGLVQGFLNSGIAPPFQGSWFSPVAAIVSLNSYPNSIVTGDFNGDGVVDLAVITLGSNAIQILLGIGDGTFTPGPSQLNYSQQLGSIVVGDFNHDGYADLAVLSTNLVLVFRGKGDGSFAAPVTTDTATSALVPTLAYIVAGDFNNDGFPDLVVEDGFTGNAYYLANSGDGTFVPARIEQGGYIPAGPLAVADFDGDGNLDVVIGYFDEVFHTTGNIYYGNGDGTFPAVSPPFEAGGPLQLVVGDFNGDGLPDIVEAAYYGANPIYFNSGGRTFIDPFASHKSAGAKAFGLSIPGSFLSVADVNGDGLTDIIQILAPGPLVVATSQLTLTSTAQITGVSPIGTGGHEVQGNYSGDTLYGASSSSGESLSAQPATPVVNLSLPVSSISTVQSLIVTISVSDGATNPTPTGSVTLTGGSYTSAAYKLTGGSASITIPGGKLAVGNATLTATYSGDKNYVPANGSTAIAVTAKAASQTSLSLSASTITQGQSLNVIATLTGVTGQPGPTGTVTLTSGTYSSSSETLANGSGTITIPAGSLAVGADTLTVAYSGDALYLAATATAQVTVTNPTLAISGTAVTVTAGATTGNTSTITVTPSGGFIGNVTLTAAIASSPTGAIHPPTFSFGSTSPVVIAGAANGTATLTIATTAPQSPSCNTNAATPGKSPWFAGGGVILACLMVFGIPARRLALRRTAGVLLLIALTGLVTACGSSGRKVCPQVIAPGTTSGTYTITVTGTAGSYSSSGNVTLTVQ